MSTRLSRLRLFKVKSWKKIFRNSHILDSQKRLTVLTQQSSGVTSQRDGEIEVCYFNFRLSKRNLFYQVWLDRTLAQDDSRGMGQPVKDNSITRNTFKIVLESTSPSSNPDSIYLVKYTSNYLKNALFSRLTQTAFLNTCTRRLSLRC